MYIATLAYLIHQPKEKKGLIISVSLGLLIAKMAYIVPSPSNLSLSNSYLLGYFLDKVTRVPRVNNDEYGAYTLENTNKH